MTGFDWDWPQLDRDLAESSLTLRFLDEGANLVIVGAHGLGKTMLLKNIALQSGPKRPRCFVYKCCKNAGRT